MSFVHLQVQSAYSLLNSSARLDQLAEKAAAKGYKALALTDKHAMYGTIAFYKLCKKHGIKPIIGLTASVFPEENEGASFPLVLLAENNTGYKNLLKISSALQTKSADGIPDKWLKSYSSGLIAITPGEKGYIEALLEEGKTEEALKAVRHYQEMFGEDSFFLALQKFSGRLDKAEGIKQFAEKANALCAVTNDVHYVEKADAFAYKTLLAIQHGLKLEDRDPVFSEPEELYLKSVSEMAELFSEYDDALENTLKIAGRCNVEIELGKARLPKYPAPNGEPAGEYLERLCLEGLKAKYREPSDAYYSRLTYELDVIQKMGFSDYFLIVWDFMKFAHDRGILTGPGRGSAAGSLVAYVLKITDVDPIEHRLLFERFLNPERVNMPDIDIDFPDTRRDEMIAYVQKKYGAMHVAQIITFGTLGARAALRDTARVMGISPKEADQLAKKLPSRPGATLETAVKESTALQKEIESSETISKIFSTARVIEGLPRHASTHAAGVVFSDSPLTETVPIQSGHHDIYLTQYSMDYLEELGLLKMDFLGLRNLSLIESIKRAAERETGSKIDFHRIGYQDEKTFELLAEGDTTGVFQLESDGMRSVLRRLAPSNLEDIIAVNSLYRPGPMENIPAFIDRKHGRMPIHYPHNDLKDILEPTYGVIVYQEQIMEIASRMAGFSLGEADLLRRAMGKKIKAVLEEERQHFLAGSMKKGYDRETANSVYDLIAKFANYGFNRSHAVAYSMIAFQLAYLKASYPLIFMAALLTSAAGNDDKIAQYIKEARQKKLPVLAPSINKSEVPFKVEKEGIRFSLSSIKNVGVAAVKEIFRARQKKPFSDLFDFCVRVSGKIVNRKIIEALILSGAMDEFGKERATLLASLDVALEHAELMTPDDGPQLDLDFEEEFTLKPKYIEVEPFKIDEKLQFEKEALGFYFSSHPVSLFAMQLRHENAVKIEQAYKMAGRRLKTGALISKVRTIRTKKGEAMAFISLSDETGDMEAVIFPQAFAKHSTLIRQGALLLLEGKADQRDGRLQLLIEHAAPLEEREEQALFLKIEDQLIEEGVLAKVKELIQAYKGNVPVYVHYPSSRKTVLLSNEHFVLPTEECMEKLGEILGKQNAVLKS
ncbi:DNA polymerase III subunit alpha [Metabacillus sp. GX 13764]|uniref:DNA polymerase III subunit alpha n=1 Tax=Metabacillus kandeliae TaxID=2900151 RepID=UPI001E654EB6|nr:DNA polymerase III subunit alpha [Metabacillus kandeliae]MCD7032789.1 DNA polymerase III subunit alpha [Metabacillus kandeliae]